LKTKRFNIALLSTLIIVALMTSMINISNLSVGTVSANPGIENIVRGYVTAYSLDQDLYPPQKLYQRGDFPLIMAFENNIGSGKGGVIAAGISSSVRGTRWMEAGNGAPYLDVLLDNAFKCVTTGKKVAWVGNPGGPQLPPYYVYNDYAACSDLIAALVSKGYTVDSFTSTITNATLAPYDILVVPQFELGYPNSGNGGDPSLLPDSVVAAIDNFVENKGGCLLIMDGNDTFGYNYCKVQNKILRPIFGSGGEYFQSDTVQDDENKWASDPFRLYVNVDNTTKIGADYQAATGTTRIGLYSVCSLAPKYDYDAALSVQPVENLEGFPGGTLVYTVNIANMGWNADNFKLTLSGNIWSATLNATAFEILPETTASTTLTVVIPTSAKFGDNDSMELTVENVQHGVSKSMTINPKVGSRVYTVHDDAQVSSAQPTNLFGNYIWEWVCSTDAQYNVLVEPHRNLYMYIKFDLRGIPSNIPPGNWTKDNLQARIYAYCWGLHMTAAENVMLYAVDNDDWTELTICWDNKPAIGSFQDNATVVRDYSWYSWDVTNYIKSQLAAGDNFASFCLKANRDNLSSENKQDFGYEFYPKESSYPLDYPYLAIGYRVMTSITPENAKGMPSGTVSYKVRVQNMGSFAENYLISIVENTQPTWPASLSSNKIELQPGKMGTVDLNVTIPGGALLSEKDNVLILVKSEHNSAENDNYYCITYVSDNRIGPAKDDTTAKSTVRLENRVWGSDVYEDGAGHWIYTALPGYTYAAAPSRGWFKFDLRGIGTTNPVRVTLNLYCRTINGRGTTINGARVQVYGVQNDNSWSEDNLCWKNMPSIGDVLDTRNVTENGMWYSWDVTNFINSQRSTDNIASFCLVDLGENVGDNCGATFVVKESSIAADNWPYLKIENVLPAQAVRVYTDPVFRGGLMSGSTENYTITVVNKGTSGDTYTLENKDNLGWSLSLDNVSLVVPAGENRQTTLHVQIPSGSYGTLDNVTVKANGTGVSDTAGCFAYRGKANIPGLGNLVAGALYCVQVDVNFLAGSDFVVRFYDYLNNFENENIFWSGGTATVVNNLAVGHGPGGSMPVKKAVKKADLVLRSGGIDRVLASFTVHQSNLRARYMAILGAWSANPGLQGAFRAEVQDILGLWAAAPA